jgi:ABC-type transport system involved in multi-copper enzyme maturation permease subunit
MFFVLLLLTLGVALATSFTIVILFKKPISQILDRIIGEDIASGWHRFLLFAIFVVGVSNGVQIWKLEQYVHPERYAPREGGSIPPLALDGPSLGLEVYRTIIQTLQGVAWALLVFFVVALIAFAIIRRGESRPAGAGK